MKILTEKLADLKVKLLSAKTDDERKAISAEIDSIIADATKVLDKLKLSNNEAETSRKEKEALQKIIDEKAKPDPPKEDPAKPDPDTEDGKMPAWAKTLSDTVISLQKAVADNNSKDQAGAKTELIKASLKTAGIAESFLGSIHVDGDDQESIDKSVATFKQTLIDEKLLSSEGVKTGEKGNIQNESILSYAKEKNMPGGSANAIVGRKLVITE